MIPPPKGAAMYPYDGPTLAEVGKMPVEMEEENVGAEIELLFLSGAADGAEGWLGIVDDEGPAGVSDDEPPAWANPDVWAVAPAAATGSTTGV